MLNEGSYYTVPSVSDLQLLGDSQLQRVAGFEVGRVGYGSIVYDDAVNLCGLRDRLDAIAGSVVVFDRRSVTVYPESGPVAERGSELNMPATVTLQQCGPSHRNTSMDAHLEALSAVPDTEFIDYDAECAAWTFKVQHFSRYGFDVDSDEEEDDDDDISKQDSSVDAAKNVEDSSRKIAFDSDSEDDMDAFVTPAVSRTRRESSPLAQSDEIDMDAAESVESVESVESPQSSPSPQFTRQTQRLSRPDTSSIKLLLRPSASKPSTSESKSSVLISKQQQQLQQQPFKLVSSAALQTKGKTQSSINDSASTFQPVAYTSSVAFSKEDRAVDAGLAMGRSFRVGWGPGGVLVMASGSKVVINPMPVVDGDRVTQASLHRATMASQLNLSQIRAVAPLSTNVRVPSAALAPRTEFNAFLSGSTQSETSVTDHESQIWQLGSALWDDLPAPRIPASLEKDNAQQAIKTLSAIARRSRVLAWLNLAARKGAAVDNARIDRSKSGQGKNGSSSSSSSSSNTTSNISESEFAMSRVFVALSSGDISGACRLAVQARSLRLATLLSQIDRADNLFSDDIQTQLAIWHRDGAIDHMAPSFSRILRLISSDLDMSQDFADLASGEDIESPLLSGLDWLRTIGCCIRYVRPLSIDDKVIPDAPSVVLHGLNRYNALLDATAASNLDDTVFRADTAFQFLAVQPAIQPPVPPYMVIEDIRSGTRVISTSYLRRAPFCLPRTCSTDLRYLLLALYAGNLPDPASVLLPRTHTVSPVDHRISWHLHTLLASRRVAQFAAHSDSMESESMFDQGTAQSRGLGDTLAANMAFQLEHLGLHGWAVFALLHISEPQSRAASITGLLGRVLPVPSADSTQSLFALLRNRSFNAFLGSMSPAAVSSIKSTLFGSSGNAKRNEDADAVSVVASEDSPSAGLEPFISDLERFLVERLLVPRQWLHLAYAARSIASDNPASAAIHYLLAGQYADAHSVVVTRVAPDAIIRGDHTTLFVLLQSLSPEATGGVLVPKWNVRGAVYLSYVLTVRRAQRVLDQAMPSGTADVSGSGNPPVKRARMANTPAAKHAPVDISDGVSLDADDSASLWDSIDRAADAHDQFNDRYSSSSSSHSAFERRLNSIVTDLRDVLTRLSTLDASSISAHYVRGFVKNGPETIKLRIAISTMATHAAELLRQAESHLNAGNINNAMQSAAASSISGTGSRKRTFAESTDDIHSRHSTAASASSWRHIRWSALPLAPDSRLSQVGSMSSDYIQAIST